MLNRNQEIAERIQQRRMFMERRFKGEYTQEQVADKLTDSGYPISQMNYSHYERGRSTLPAELLEKLAPILGVSVEWFFNDEAPIDDFTEEVMQESIRLVGALDGKSPDFSQDTKDGILTIFRTVRKTVEQT